MTSSSAAMGSDSFIIAFAGGTAPLAPESVFGRGGPLEVDVGCGKGRFLLARAAAHPAHNFLGIDRRRKRVQKVDRKLRREGLTNVRLLAAEASDVILRRLPPDSVATFYVFFPDPWPKRRHHRRRLFGPLLLHGVHRALRADGVMHIATDHAEYLEEIRGLFASDPRFRETASYQPAEEERSEFELTFARVGKPVGRRSFRKAEAAASSAAPPRPHP